MVRISGTTPLDHFLVNINTQGQAGHIPRDWAERLARPCRTPLPRVCGAEEGGQEEAALQEPQAHGRTREAPAGREAHAGRALVPGGDVGPHLGGAARPRRGRFRHLPCRGAGVPRLRASGASCSRSPGFAATRGRRSSAPSTGRRTGMPGSVPMSRPRRSWTASSTRPHGSTWERRACVLPSGQQHLSAPILMH